MLTPLPTPPTSFQACWLPRARALRRVGAVAAAAAVARRRVRPHRTAIDDVMCSYIKPYLTLTLTLAALVVVVYRRW